MPNDVPADVLTLSYKDFSEEVSSTTVNVNQSADYPTYQGLLSSLESAIGAVTNGNQVSREVSLPQRLSNAAGAAGSMREYKLLIRYEDDVTFERGYFTIPTFDISAVTMVTGTDRVDLTLAPMPALVTAVQGFVISKVGNSVTVLEAVAVGRNL